MQPYETPVVKLRRGSYYFPGVSYYHIDRLDTYFPDDPNTMGVEIHPDGWGQVEPEKGKFNWEPLDAILELYRTRGKQAAIRIQCASFQPDDTPRWLFRDYGVRRICGESVFTSFEDGTNGYRILDGAALCEDSAFAPASYSKKYLRGTGRLLSSGKRNFSEQFGQTIGFDCFSASGGRISVAVKRGGEMQTVAEIELKRGERKSCNIDVGPDVIGGGAEVLWSFDGVEVCLGHPGITEDRPGLYSVGNVCFPNYFDPIFQEHYASFVRSFAQRYRNESALCAVCVGGYGRWDEVSLEDTFGQWKAFGYTADRYLEHMKWCAELFIDAFAGSGKQIYMQGYTEWLPNPQPEADYVSRKMINYIADRGLGLKTNSLQAKLTEWDTEGGVAWSYMLNRLKHSGIAIFHEEAAQCANENACFQNMGHPLSMLNRAIIDGVDYYWLYSSDLYTPYSAKYLHYANEQAGTGLFTRLYILFGEYPFVQKDGRVSHSHPNICCGLWLREHDWNHFTVKEGRKVLLAQDSGKPIELSIDDRQKYNGMYGSVLTVDYLDTEGGSFAVMVQEEGQTKETPLGVVHTEGSGKWKSAGFYSTAWGHSEKDYGRDLMVEIRLVPLSGSKPLYFSGVSVDFVPAREWMEKVLIPSGETARRADADGISIFVPVPEEARASSLMLPVCTVNVSGPSNLAAAAEAVLADGRRMIVSRKQFYMASEKRAPLVLPVAEAPADTIGFQVTLHTLEGQMAVYLNQQGNPAVELRGYMTEEESGICGEEGLLAAARPFGGISVDRGFDGHPFHLFRIVTDKEVLIAEGFVHQGRIALEPQTAGKYRLKIDGRPAEGRFLALRRIEQANAPLRQIVGKQTAEGFCTAKSSAMWKAVKGFSKLSCMSGGGVEALIGEKDAVFESAELSIKAQKDHMFHFVIKNETASGFVRLYWKTEDTPIYLEENSTMIPIVPNDTECREYCWPLGESAGYSGVIKGFQVCPAAGETCTGRLTILMMELRSGEEDLTMGKLLPLIPIEILDGSPGTKFGEQ